MKNGRLFAAVVMACFVSLVSALHASPWAIVPISNTNTLFTIDLGTTPPTIYGPFLNGPFATNTSGQNLGPMGTEGGGRFDIVVTPNNRNALISNFGDSSVYKLDITDLKNPVVVGVQTNIGFFAEDMAMAPNGRFALVTDGGFSPRIAILNIETMDVVTNILDTNRSFQAVAIAPDNRTVLTVDYFSRQVSCGLLKEDLSGFETMQDISLTNAADPEFEGGRPVNISISPDGQTALVADAATNCVFVLQITGPGTATLGVTPMVTGLGWTNAGTRGSQSIVFSRDGKRAYVENAGDGASTNGQDGNWLSWMNVNGPGNVTLGGAAVARLNARGTSQLFGVDTIAMTPDGDHILCSNPTLSGGTNVLSLVDTATFAITEIPLGLWAVVGDEFYVPAGIAIVTPPVFNDFDNDGASDLAIYDRAAAGWFVRKVDGAGAINGQAWGYTGVSPVVGDFNGDGLADLAVFDSAAGKWYVKSNRNGAGIGFQASWGYKGTVAAAGDYNADGASDLAVYDTTSGKWYIRTLEGRTLLWNDAWGYKGALPVAGDYDGDGTWDQAVYESATGMWNVKSLDNRAILWQNAWGYPGTLAVAGDYNGDGKFDQAVYDVNAGAWYIRSATGEILAWKLMWGSSGMIPVAGDYDGDGISDLAVYQPTTGKWYVRTMGGTVLAWGMNWGGFATAQAVAP